jgi:predicted metal-binding membrane protein
VIGAAALATRRRRVLGVIGTAIAVAWAAAIAADLAGASRFLHHDALIEGGWPLPAALAIFVVAWQLMIAAMMLPSSMPLVRLFVGIASRQERPARATSALIGGYAIVWTAFGVAAFLLDVVVHRTVERVPFLETHPQLIAASVLLVAGAFQFSELKDRCLRECRHPGPFLMSHYARGARAAFRLGVAHGVFCLGCCWALMLVGFAAGVANLWWMAALTAVMVYEKTARRGREAMTPIGVGLIASGVVTLFQP